jgi:hypothetical protein
MMLSEFRKSAIPRKGDRIIIGSPERIQCDIVFANRMSESEW